MGKKNKRQRAQNRIAEGANVSKKIRTAVSSFSKKKARAAEKTMQQELAKRKKQAEQKVLQEQAMKSTIRKKQARVPYYSSDWILLIGEGNFSFARALGRMFEGEAVKTGQIVATSYDSLEDLLEKYPETPEILSELNRLGVTVLHGIDATSLHSSSSLHSSIHHLVSLQQQQQLLQQQQQLASSVPSSSSFSSIVLSSTSSGIDSSSFSSSSSSLSKSALTKRPESVAYVEKEDVGDGADEGEEEVGEGDEEEEEGKGDRENEERGGKNDNEEVYEEEGGEEGEEGEDEEGEDEEDEEEEVTEEEKKIKGPVNVFNKIVFNFPHTGCGVKDTIENNRIHQKFMLKFFASASRLLKPPFMPVTAAATITDEPEKKIPTEVSGKDRHRWDRDNQMKDKRATQLKAKKNKDGSTPGLKLSEIHVTLKQGEPYSSWQVPRLARNAGLRAKSGVDFFPELYPGYEHRRTRGVARENPNEFILKGGQSKGAGFAKTYVFVPIIAKDET